jgi:hypothetical protein
MQNLLSLLSSPDTFQLSSAPTPPADPFSLALAMFAQRQQDQQAAQPPDQNADLAQSLTAPAPPPTTPEPMMQAAQAAYGFGPFAGGAPAGAPAAPTVPAAPPALPVTPASTSAKPQPLGAKPTKTEIATGVREGGQIQEKAIEDEAQALAAQKEYVAQQTFAAMQDQQTQADTLTQAREAIHQRYQERLGRVNEEIDRLGQQKPDPSGYFHDRSTLSNILTFIGVALGGYQSAKTGRNPALELLQRQIDQHVEAQARGFQQQMATLQERKGAAKEEATSNLDMLEYKTVQTVAANNRVIQMIGAAASKYDSPQILARAQQAIGQLRQNNAMKMEELRAKSVQEGLQYAQQNLQQKEFTANQEHWQKTYELEVAKAVQSGDVAKADALRKAQSQSIFAVIDPETKAPIVAPSDKVAEDMNGKIGAADQAYNAIGDILTLNENGYAVPWAERRQRADSLTIDLQNSLSKLADQGVITASDADRYGKLLGAPARLISNDPRLRQAQGEIIDKINYAIKARTGRPGLWKANADPTYASSIRPPGFKPSGTLEGLPDPNKMTAAAAGRASASKGMLRNTNAATLLGIAPPETLTGRVLQGGRGQPPEEEPTYAPASPESESLRRRQAAADFRAAGAEPLPKIPTYLGTGAPPRIPGQNPNLEDDDLLNLAGLMRGR